MSLNIRLVSLGIRKKEDRIEMEEDDTEDIPVTLTSKLVKKKLMSATKKTTMTKTTTNALEYSSIRTFGGQISIRRQDSADESDTIEYASENEVENIPKDEDYCPEPLVIDEKGNRISGIDRHSVDLPEEVESLLIGPRENTSHRFSSTTICVNEEDNNTRSTSTSRYSGSRFGLFMSRPSPQSSSSQEEYEPEVKSLTRLQKHQLQQQQQQQQQQQHQQQHLLTTGSSGGQVTARSMESLRSSRNFLSADDRYSDERKSLESLTSSSETHLTTSKSHYRSFLTSSSKDVRRIVTQGESKSSDNLHREESLNAEVRRGLFANTGLERKLPQHLSLPPPSNVFSLTSPGGSDRKITILSPHSPIHTTEFQFSAQTLKSRRKKAIVLPRLVLPRSDSEVFLDFYTIIGNHFKENTLWSGITDNRMSLSYFYILNFIIAYSDCTLISSSNSSSSIDSSISDNSCNNSSSSSSSNCRGKFFLDGVTLRKSLSKRCNRKPKKDIKQKNFKTTPSLLDNVLQANSQIIDL
ncbi:hypothetical protein M0802_003821 [Mischocyttarus mexicanus]|nr:hypothetical protein M0802_003821 [Mischocyttarus mexicanus]